MLPHPNKFGKMQTNKNQISPVIIQTVPWIYSSGAFVWVVTPLKFRVTDQDLQVFTFSQMLVMQILPTIQEENDWVM